MTSPTGTRDFRIDFFRGLALIMIFIDHIPGNALANLTLRRAGFSDAAEVFVLLSGISAAIAYGATYRRSSWLVGSARVVGRCGKIYVAHLVTLLAVAGLAMFLGHEFGTLEFVDRLGLHPLFSETEDALVASLTMRFLPHYLDILPLYVILLALVPFAIGLARRRPLHLLGASAAVYVMARTQGWNLPRYAEGEVWYFNPFAWQLLFIIGLVIGAAYRSKDTLPWRPVRELKLAAAFIAFAFLAAAPWQIIPGLQDVALLPASWRPDPDKTDLSLWRLLNVLAQACVVAYFIPRETRLKNCWLAQQVARCGSQSLELYCVATILSLLAFTAFTEGFGTDLPVQVLVNGIGIATMLAAARLISWYRSKPWQTVQLAVPASMRP